ncbi:MAG: hypothetical protein IT270_18970, partial [Saprospiraceae bacterium]|nr:hypothetical protein [Saprospiraceae bacterium]
MPERVFTTLYHFRPEWAGLLRQTCARRILTLLLGLIGLHAHVQAQSPWSNQRTRIVPMPTE